MRAFRTASRARAELAQAERGVQQAAEYLAAADKSRDLGIGIVKAMVSATQEDSGDGGTSGGGIGERIFDLLQEKANTFKCENCDDWMDLSHKAKGMGEDTLFCNPCVDEMDGKDPQHEDEE
jgi:hypothetical protein